MKIVTIVGARPQFIKAATVSRAIREHNARGPEVVEVLIHTGQHFDDNMSRVFFDEMDIAAPAYNLGISSLRHGAMTGRMLEAIETALVEQKPDWVLTYGDTNSTLAGALAAVKLHVPCAHVEAGVRSYNRRMPEEVNRIVADRICNLLLCPTRQAIENLRREGIADTAKLTGDVMYDATLYYRTLARERHSLAAWDVEPRRYALCTVHRPENTDDPARLQGILDAVRIVSRDVPVVFPVHPRTRKLIAGGRLAAESGTLRLIDPVSYLEMTRLESDALAILTDSGGVQKEAFFHGVPCLTLREETEWVETVELGWNTLCGADPARIARAWSALHGAVRVRAANPYGDGNAAGAILRALLDA